MRKYANKSIREYLDDLAARKPAPGGGSAAALVGATAAALLSMVANFTIGKPKYKKFQKDIKKSLKESGKIRKKLLELVDLDVITYNKVARNKKISFALHQKSLKEATIVPVKITELSFQALNLCPVLAKKGNKYLISDVHVANSLLRAAIKSAIVNVKINLPYIKDKKFVARIKQQFKSWRI
ncbi:MAG: cyclodeaminase/cyclohydrolase family protein [Candidatus Omnitrophota bacterium]